MIERRYSIKKTVLTGGIRMKRIRLVICTLLAVLIVSMSVLSVSAIDEKYYLKDLGMTVRLPNSYYTITRETQKDDPVFRVLNVGYDETMTAFHAAEIYLQSQDGDRRSKISISMTEDETSKALLSYGTLKDDQLNELIKTYESEGIYKNGEIKKHNGFTTLDFDFERKTDDKVIYGQMINTVINGMNLVFTLQKDNEIIIPDESRVFTNMVNTMSFDKILEKNGPSFEWWRVLLWILIMAMIIFVIYFIYHQNEVSKKKKESLRERRRQSAAKYAAGASYESSLDSKYSENSGDDEAFDEILGYGDKKEYEQRSLNDIETLDIRVKEKRDLSGIEYFEDEGRSLITDEDYFDKYFTEQTQPVSKGEKVIGTVKTYTKIGARRVGNFINNVGNSKKKKDDYKDIDT